MEALFSQLRDALGKENVHSRAIDRYAFAPDAGPYYLVPKVVVQPRNEADIQALFRLAKQYKMPITFRTGGTSLSGQSVTDSILADISKHWKGMEIDGNGEFVKVQPANIGAQVNTRLKAFQRKIGPDPSSIASAMMGGILSNNSSGMCCGVAQNAYHTLKSIRFILPDGSIWDTGQAGEAAKFEKEKQTLAQILTELRQNILKNSTLSQKIRNKYKQKNTVGYGLNAFLDYETPLEILAHLLIGAEGTLAFISEATLETVPDYPHKKSILLYFEDIVKACDAIQPLADWGCMAVELMDSASLKSVENLPDSPSELKELLANYPQLTAILCEAEAEGTVIERSRNHQTDAALTKFIEEKLSFLSFKISHSPQEQAKLWKIRKGMYPAVAAVRNKGEAVILEDVAFPLEQMRYAIPDLQALFLKHGYENGIIFGHAKDGNIHFVITQPLNEEKDVARYAHFIEDLVELVLKKYDGALKAEHGTGRNMAPFVETEWGTEAFALMQKLKAALDPENILNPGVILPNSSTQHLDNLKDLPIVEDLVDTCVECGACEPRCPSREFTLTPRQRIALRRAEQRLSAAADIETLTEIQKDYVFSGLETCATDGLCSLACPVGINTGELVKELRGKSHSETAQKLAFSVAKNFFWVESGLKIGLGLGGFSNSLLGENSMEQLTKWAKQLFPSLPQWQKGMQVAQMPASPFSAEEADLIYFPTCISRMMGGTASDFLPVAQLAGLKVHLAENKGTCCGQAFSSKGYPEAANHKWAESIEKMHELSQGGKIPIMLDLSSCTAHLQHLPAGISPEIAEKWKKLQILDSIDIALQIAESRTWEKKKRIAIHTVCSAQKNEWAEKLIRCAHLLAEKVDLPQGENCCGMGGDRGMQIPELVENACKTAKKQLSEQEYAGCYTSAQTCAFALNQQSQYKWESVFGMWK